MKFLILAIAVLTVAVASPQRRQQPKQQQLQQPQQQQQRSLDQQQQPSDQDYRQPINVPDFNQPQQNYKQDAYKQDAYKQDAYKQDAYKSQDFKVRDSDERTTTWIPIIKFAKEQETDGSYKTSYETGNNIIAEETGFLKNNAENEIPSLVQHGSYSYSAPDGQLITVEYTADEFGFRATGPHIPTPPPVSPEIQKGLDLIYAGIKANEERQAREQKEHPEEYAKKQADRAALDFAGHYYPQ